MLSGEFISEFLACFMQNKIKYARRPLQFGWEGARRQPSPCTDRAGSGADACSHTQAGVKPALYMPGLHRAPALPDPSQPPGCLGAAGRAQGAIMALPAPVPGPTWRPGPCRWQRCHSGAEPIRVSAARFCLPCSFSPNSQERKHTRLIPRLKKRRHLYLYKCLFLQYVAELPMRRP